MPYPTLESLPEGVKGIPKAAQEIWRNAANSALERYPGDEERAAKIAWGAVKNAGWAKDAEGNWRKVHFEPPESGDAPKEVKDILQSAYDSCRSTWIKEHPDDRENAANKESCARIAWSAVEKAGWSKDADGKWAKKHAKMHEFDAEVFSVGTWNGDKYTEEDLHEMAYAFHELRGKVKPPVKLAHENKVHLQDGQPALGWVKELRKVGEKLIATLTDVPDILFKAIKANRYKRISAEVYWNLNEGGKTFKRVLAAVGLLGTDIPAVTNLADLQAFLAQTPDTGTFEKMASYSFDVDESGKIQDEQEVLNMADENQIKKLTDDLQEAKAKLEQAEGEGKTYKAEAEALKKEKSEGLKKARMDEIKAFCEEMVKAGKMTPAARDILVKDLDKHVYSDEGGFALSFDAFKKCIETHAKVLPMGEKGKEGEPSEGEQYANAAEELAAKTKKYMVEHKDVNYVEASQAVLELDKELAKRYANE